MDAAELYPGESATVPDDHLLAIIMQPDEAGRTIQMLSASGFSWNEIGTLRQTEKGVQTSGGKDFLAELMSAATGTVNGVGAIKQYRKAVLNGRTVIAVEAKTGAARDKARQILKREGARFLTFLLAAGRKVWMLDDYSYAPACFERRWNLQPRHSRTS